jgi:hypothetical protein
MEQEKVTFFGLSTNEERDQFIAISGTPPLHVRIS